MELPKVGDRLGELLGHGASLVISDEPLGSMLRLFSLHMRRFTRLPGCGGEVRPNVWLRQ
jgi:hypothetical protein